MKANTNYSEGISGDEPFQRPSIMDQFDMMVLRAAEKKRNDIVNRYGDEGCSKLLARKERREQPRKKVSRSKSHYERTIQELREAQKEISSNKEPTTSQKENEKPAAVQEQYKSNDDEDFDIDELFELAWGCDISTGFKKEAKDENNDDTAFAKKIQENTVRKLLKARETTRATRTWRIRRTKSKETCPESNRSWHMGLA